MYSVDGAPTNSVSSAAVSQTTFFSNPISGSWCLARATTFLFLQIPQSTSITTVQSNISLSLSLPFCTYPCCQDRIDRLRPKKRLPRSAMIQKRAGGGVPPQGKAIRRPSCLCRTDSGVSDQPSSSAGPLALSCHALSSMCPVPMCPVCHGPCNNMH